MIIENLPEDIHDFTIIGSGPAGLTLAMKLSEYGKNVLVLEAGGEFYNDESQKMYDGKVIGNKYFDLKEARLRMFGGSSNHWGGACVDFSDMDFRSWPISPKDLNLYSKEAQKILNIQIQANQKFSKNFDQTFVSTSNVVFSSEYEDKLKQSKNISILFDCALIKINGNKNYVNSIDINFKNYKRTIKVKNLIIACGGIENSRILLWSQKKSDSAFLSNLNIGKKWMEHPILSVGYFIPHEKLENKIKKENFINIIPTNKNLFENQINNVRLKLFLFENNHEQKDKHKEMLREFLCLAPNFSRKIIKNFFKKDLNCVGGIVAFCEQLPDNNNKVTLSKNEIDKFGVPKTSLYWTVQDNLKVSLKKTLDLLSDDFIDSDMGRIGLNEFIYDPKVQLPEKIDGGYHHMGGTPMGNHSDTSICDKNLRVHGLKNLFIAGSSTFPTGSHANPTYHIVRLSLRLAKYLSELV